MIDLSLKYVFFITVLWKERKAQREQSTIKTLKTFKSEHPFYVPSLIMIQHFQILQFVFPFLATYLYAKSDWYEFYTDTKESAGEKHLNNCFSAVSGSRILMEAGTCGPNPATGL